MIVDNTKKSPEVAYQSTAGVVWKDEGFTPIEIERRLKLMLVSGEFVKALFQNGEKHSIWNHFEGIEGVNDGKLQVRAVEWSMMRQCFEVLLWHPSFDVVEEGFSVPDFEVNVMWCDAHTTEGQKTLNTGRNQLRRIQFRRTQQQKKKVEKESTRWETSMPPVGVEIVLKFEGFCAGGKVTAYDHATGEFCFQHGNAMLRRISKAEFKDKGGWMAMKEIEKIP